jgi:hypothetical protein
MHFARYAFWKLLTALLPLAHPAAALRGPMPWLVCSEVQPMHTRAAGTALATIVNFVLTFIIGQCFLSMLCAMRYGVFFFFAGEHAASGVQQLS